MNAHSYLKIIIIDEYLAIKEQFKESKLVLIAFIVAIIGLLIYLKPFPDKTLAFATSYAGSDWSIYAETAREYLKQEGLDVSIVNTDGAVENVLRLKNDVDNVNVAFTYGSALNADQVKGIYSLGSIDYQPIWIFYRKSKVGVITNIADLAKLKVGLGPTKSGSYIIAKKLFQAYDINIDQLENIKSNSFLATEEKFLKGEFDVLISVSSHLDPIIQTLMREPGVELFDFKYATGFQKVFNSFVALKLPASSIDVYKKLPHQDVGLLATTTSLVVRKDMHPDLQLALLIAGKDMLRNSTDLFFSKRNEFPAYMDPTIPLSPVAARFYDYGPPQAMRYLPFWLAGFVDRAWLLLLTIFAIFYPLSKLNLHIRKFRFSIRKRPYYEEMLAIENRICHENLSDEDKKKIFERLNIININAIQHHVPIGDESEYFSFLHAIHLLKMKLKFD
ncbi:TAXI family TRAP transporter solute-binding subunit [Polynucleobacter antarcticus]|uniref:TRAP transporter solute receptor, TAXI family n=1 Tax=Polynucleobacter antarcticus TaxID=1743162 RepID=A0A6M9PGT4_9BURK|nr:TAXI family TRAP transporter solute-binding subunit [Polynucleobacter antarcticus]QKM62040.1 hypothetical protein DCO16_02470 [Polynucleobacter antarcticus]